MRPERVRKVRAARQRGVGVLTGVFDLKGSKEFSPVTAFLKVSPAPEHLAEKILSGRGWTSVLA